MCVLLVVKHSSPRVSRSDYVSTDGFAGSPYISQLTIHQRVVKRNPNVLDWFRMRYIYVFNKTIVSLALF